MVATLSAGVHGALCALLGKLALHLGERGDHGGVASTAGRAAALGDGYREQAAAWLRSPEGYINDCVGYWPLNVLLDGPWER